MTIRILPWCDTLSDANRYTDYTLGIVYLVRHSHCETPISSANMTHLPYITQTLTPLIICITFLIQLQLCSPYHFIPLKPRASAKRPIIPRAARALPVVSQLTRMRRRIKVLKSLSRVRLRPARGTTPIELPKTPHLTIESIFHRHRLTLSITGYDQRKRKDARRPKECRHRLHRSKTKGKKRQKCQKSRRRRPKDGNTRNRSQRPKERTEPGSNPRSRKCKSVSQTCPIRTQIIYRTHTTSLADITNTK